MLFLFEPGVAVFKFDTGVVGLGIVDLPDSFFSDTEIQTRACFSHM